MSELTRGPVAVCLGTRPEAVKLAPVIHSLQDLGAPTAVVSSGQHREMLDQMLDHFGLSPDVDLALMRPEQSLAQLSARAIERFDEAFGRLAPSCVVVQGDTATALCAALAAFYRRIPVAHVEAGLRTFDLGNPFPEEGNRQLIGRITDWHFAPTERAAAVLRAEGVPGDNIVVSGNPVIDAALWTAERLDGALVDDDGRRRILVTLHRRETQGDRQRDISRMLRSLADRGDVRLTFPVHLSPAVRRSVVPELEGHPAVDLVEPLDYPSFIAELSAADLVVTDSGGVQEEAPAFGVPVVVCRDTTERQEGVDAGCAVLAGSDPDAIREHVVRLLDDDGAYGRMSDAPCPYGDGTAGEAIARRLTADVFDAQSAAAGRVAA
jgi:UDP-N-acetylglucosamine 2-epimerase (non-hydrolysing)